MSNQKFDFTRTTIIAIQPPPQGRLYCYDVQTRSLVIDVTAGGSKTFQVYRKVNGKPTRIVLGKFNPALSESRDIPTSTDPLTLIGNAAELNVRMARKIALAINASLDKGINPAQQVRLAREIAMQELTLQQAFDRYYRDHLLPHGKKTATDLRNDFDRYLGKVAPGQKKLRGKEKVKSEGAVDWEARKLSTISPGDVRAMMISLKEKVGARTANKAFVLLRSIYNSMIAWRIYRGENPCADITKFNERSRDRFMTGEEIPRFMTALDKVPHQDFKDFILLSLYTGARRANVLAMRWVDLNLDLGIWTIPGEVSKNSNTLTVPLTSAVRTLLTRRKSEKFDAGDSPYVFPAKSATGYMSPPTKRWKSLLAEAKIDNLRLHDLRRSLGSWAAISGTSLPVIGKMLGHRSAEATAVYARLSSDPVIQAMETAVAAIQEKAKPATGKSNGTP